MGLACSCTPASNGRPGRSGLDDRGFIMVVLLVGMAIVAIWMSAALPAWRQQMQRQREEDLIFRGEQYARAIVTYQKKNQGAYPPNIDILVQNRYLRKKWKDPITNDDFVPVGAGLAGSERATTPRGAQAPIAPSIGGTPPGRPGGAGPGQQQQTAQNNQPPGVSGVRSKSNATSIKIYQGQQQHSLWAFDAQQLYGRMGYSPARGGQPPGARPGGPGTGRDAGPGAPQGPRGGPGGRQVGPGGPAPPPPPPVGGRGRGPQ
jgi:type II secretory pathway pseudopilin PulG